MSRYCVNRFSRMTLSTLFLLAATAAHLQADTVVSREELAEEGSDANATAYIKVVDGYRPLTRIEGMDYLNYDFSSRLFAMPVMEDIEQPVTLMFQSEHFVAEWTNIETRHIETLGMNAEAEYTVDKLSDEQYEVTLSNPTDSDRILLVNLGWHTDAVYGVALADPVAELESLYGPDTDHNPVSAEYTLGLMASQADAPEAVQDLHQYWVDEITRAQAADFFDYVEESWEEYENAEAATDRLSALEEVQELAETYLDDFPNGAERDQVRSRLDDATKRLDSL